MALPTVSLKGTRIQEEPHPQSVYLNGYVPSAPGTVVECWEDYMEISGPTYRLCKSMLGGECGFTVDLQQIDMILAIPTSEWQGSPSSRVMTGSTSSELIREELETIRSLIKLRGKVLLFH